MTAPATITAAEIARMIGAEEVVETPGCGGLLTARDVAHHRVSERTAKSVMLRIGGERQGSTVVIDRGVYDAWIERGGDPQPTKAPTPLDKLLRRRQRVASTKAPCTYLIESPGVPLVKIGRSKNLAQRFFGLQCSCPVPLRIVTTFKGVDLEKTLHEYFAAHRRHGEWFDAAPVYAQLREWGIRDV